MEQKRRKILTLDGGGIKGVFAAAFLETIEESTGKRIAEHFDLIAGTSTGGIIALGLGLGMSAREITQFYVNEGPRQKRIRPAPMGRAYRYQRRSSHIVVTVAEKA